MARTGILLWVILLLLPADSRAQTHYRLLKLPSGKEIKLLGVGRFSPSPERTVLMLKYETDLNIDDKQALRKEVDEIWVGFRLSAEKENLSEAIISANEALRGGFGSTYRSYDFEYRKSQDGTWHMISK